MLRGRPVAGNVLPVGTKGHHLAVQRFYLSRPSQRLPAGRSNKQIISAAAAAAPNSNLILPPLPQQPQQPSLQLQQTPANGISNTRKTRRQVPKPFLVRIAGRTSDVKAASGAVVKRLRTEDMVRVAAIDPESLSKAMITLTAANRMSQSNSNQMLVFQPVLIDKAAAAEPPRVPKGSMVMYTTQIMQGEVMTNNTLRVTATTEHRALAKAIIARVAINSHTVMECYGTAALTVAVQAVARARKGLLIKHQDIACVIASSSKSSVSSSDSRNSTADSAPNSSSSKDPASSSDSSSRAATCHRLVVLECQPRRPRSLLVTSAVGVSDKPLQQAPSQ